MDKTTEWTDVKIMLCGTEIKCEKVFYEEVSQIMVSDLSAKINRHASFFTVKLTETEQRWLRELSGITNTIRIPRKKKKQLKAELRKKQQPRQLDGIFNKLTP